MRWPRALPLVIAAIITLMWAYWVIYGVRAPIESESAS